MSILKKEGCPLAPEGSKAHNYRILRESYNKKIDPNERRPGVVLDHSASYAMLFCRQCGESKEIKVT